MDESAISFVHSTTPSEVHTCSKCLTKKPQYLQAYHCGSLSHTTSVPSTSHPLSNVLCYDKLKGNFKAAVMPISSLREPAMFSQASGILKWDRAMSEELHALEQNNT